MTRAPEDIYETEYLRFKKLIPADLETYSQDVIDELAREESDGVAAMLLDEVGQSDFPCAVLESALSGTEDERDTVTLAIDAVAHWKAVQIVQGFWPQWKP